MTEQARTDRIDFEILPTGKVVITKMYRHRTKSRDIPHSTIVHARGFDLVAALQWLRDNGFTVWTWPVGKTQLLGARAWRGQPWPVRTAYQILRKRRELEQLAKQVAYSGKYANSSNGPGWDYRSLQQADLAYVAEPRPTYSTEARE